MAADVGSVPWSVFLESTAHFLTSCLRILSFPRARTLILGWQTAPGYQSRFASAQREPETILQ